MELILIHVVALGLQIICPSFPTIQIRSVADSSEFELTEPNQNMLARIVSQTLNIRENCMVYGVYQH